MIDDLYSTRILTLAANLPHAGRLASPAGTGERVAKLCGSRATVDVVLDDQGRIVDFAQDVKACALGQAAAGVVGESVIGATAQDLTEARDAMAAMLKSGGEGPSGRFEGLRILKQVADYPARHASTMVAVEATLEAVQGALDARTRLAGAA
jgi:NifU-like protein involved in Fe-S cluster formation